MTDFAVRTGVSQPTITRFCEALGFSGFRELKIRRAQCIASDVPAPVEQLAAVAPPAATVRRHLLRHIGRRA
jgi:RpiR family transcriptional regulator, carbohydrate utilization regulator